MKSFTHVNRSLKILLFTNSLILMAGAMLGPIYAIFVEGIGGSILDASIAGSIFALFAGITTLLSGKYSDVIKENELVVVFGYIIMAFGFLLYVFVDSIYLLFIAQALIGIGEAIYSPAFDALYSKHINKKQAGAQWRIWEAMYYFITAIGALLGGIFVVWFGFKAMFIIMAFLCFIPAMYILRLNRRVL